MRATYLLKIVTTACHREQHAFAVKRLFTLRENMRASATTELVENDKGPFIHTLRVSALRVAMRETVTQCISMVAFTHTLRRAALCCAVLVKTHEAFYQRRAATSSVRVNSP